MFGAYARKREYMHVSRRAQTTDRPGATRSAVQVSGIRYQASGVRYQGSGVRYQESGVRYQVSGIRCQVSGIRCQVSGVRYQESAVRSQLAMRARRLRHLAHSPTRLRRHRLPTAN